MEARIILIGGPSGAGKTTIINMLRSREGASIISTGDIFHEYVRNSLQSDMQRKEFRENSWKKIEPQVTLKIVERIKNNISKTLILDTHYAIYTKEGFAQSMDSDNLRQIGKVIKEKGYQSCDCLLITAPASEIEKRLERDNTREKSELLKLRINEDVESNLKMQKRYSEILSEFVETKQIAIENINLEETFGKIKLLFDSKREISA